MNDTKQAKEKRRLVSNMVAHFKDKKMRKFHLKLLNFDAKDRHGNIYPSQKVNIITPFMPMPVIFVKNVFQKIKADQRAGKKFKSENHNPEIVGRCLKVKSVPKDGLYIDIELLADRSELLILAPCAGTNTLLETIDHETMTKTILKINLMTIILAPENSDKTIKSIQAQCVDVN